PPPLLPRPLPPAANPRLTPLRPAPFFLGGGAAPASASFPRRLAEDRGSHSSDLGRAGRGARESAHRGNGAALHRAVRGALHPRLRALGAAGAAGARQPVARGGPPLRGRAADHRALARLVPEPAAPLPVGAGG